MSVTDDQGGSDKAPSQTHSSSGRETATMGDPAEP